MTTNPEPPKDQYKKVFNEIKEGVKGKQNTWIALFFIGGLIAIFVGFLALIR
jgi:hypothetical protein